LRKNDFSPRFLFRETVGPKGRQAIVLAKTGTVGKIETSEKIFLRFLFSGLEQLGAKRLCPELGPLRHWLKLFKPIAIKIRTDPPNQISSSASTIPI
jgi:hypothetical protein